MLFLVKIMLNSPLMPLISKLNLFLLFFVWYVSFIVLDKDSFSRKPKVLLGKLNQYVAIFIVIFIIDDLIIVHFNFKWIY